jgi:hypothetical protein
VFKPILIVALVAQALQYYKKFFLYSLVLLFKKMFKAILIVALVAQALQYYNHVRVQNWDEPTEG